MDTPFTRQIRARAEQRLESLGNAVTDIVRKDEGREGYRAPYSLKRTPRISVKVGSQMTVDILLVNTPKELILLVRKGATEVVPSVLGSEIDLAITKTFYNRFCQREFGYDNTFLANVERGPNLLSWTLRLLRTPLVQSGADILNELVDLPPGLPAEERSHLAISRILLKTRSDMTKSADYVERLLNVISASHALAQSQVVVPETPEETLLSVSSEAFPSVQPQIGIILPEITPKYLYHAQIGMNLYSRDLAALVMMACYPSLEMAFNTVRRRPEDIADSIFTEVVANKNRIGRMINDIKKTQITTTQLQNQERSSEPYYFKSDMPSLLMEGYYTMNFTVGKTPHVPTETPISYSDGNLTPSYHLPYAASVTASISKGRQRHEVSFSQTLHIGTAPNQVLMIINLE